MVAGVAESDQTGVSIGGLGDVNGDRIDDFIVGASGSDLNLGANSDPGASLVVFGSTSGFDPVFKLASLLPSRGGDGTLGFALPGFDQVVEGLASGDWVGSAGDINADGVPDIMISAPHGAPRDQFEVGEIFIVYGRGAEGRFTQTR